MTKSPLVSIVIPTLNAADYLENCLQSIKLQSYRKIEVIIVDGGSTDNTLKIAKKFKTKIFHFDPNLPPDKYAATHRRNYGVKKSAGEYIYYIDSDYELTKNVVRECVNACVLHGFSAVIHPLDTFGVGIWARAKNLERRCYFGDDTVESPRFFKKSVWRTVGGLDEKLMGGGDDWDLYQKLLERNFKVGRIKSIVRNNEGNLTLGKLFKRAFFYSKDSLKYLHKRPKQAFKSYFPIRASYIRNWKLFIKRPKDTLALIIARTVEYFGGALGVAYSLIKND